MSEPLRSYTARVVFPVAGPPIPRGVVVVRGESIVAVEPPGRVADLDFGNAAIIPGLVNAHTHLDLSGARGATPPTDPDHFTDWLRSVIAYRRQRTELQVRNDIRHGLAECLRTGTTLLGDIAANGCSWGVLVKAKVRAVVFYELIGRDAKQLEQSWEIASLVAGFTGWVFEDAARWGISPHSPYTIPKRYAEVMFAVGSVSATHVAETPAEAELLEHRRGPFVEFLTAMGTYRAEDYARSWEDFLTPTHSTAPVQQRLIVHGNYLPTDFPFRPEQSLCYCPRTHAAFGHSPHPFRQFRKRGVRVCLGTDSLASNPDLDILAEARFVYQREPGYPGDDLLRMATLSGAEALGWSDVAGSLEPGKSADFVVVPLPDSDANDPHTLLFADYPGDRLTYYRGQPRHA